MTEKHKKAVTALLMLLDADGFQAFAEIPYLELIKPLIRRDHESGCSYQKLSIRYQITFAQARRLVKNVSKVDNLN
jgi:hypothetical protein